MFFFDKKMRSKCRFEQKEAQNCTQMEGFEEKGDVSNGERVSDLVFRFPFSVFRFYHLACQHHAEDGGYVAEGAVCLYLAEL